MNSPDWLANFLRTIFTSLDAIGYRLVSAVYNIFFTVAKAQLFSGNTVDTFFSRVQLILGVLMTFKLALTALNIIINPDSYKDKEKGASKLVMRIVMALVMLTLIIPIDIPEDAIKDNPLNQKISENGILFGFLYQFQSAIMDENILGKLILGSNAGSSNDGNLDNLSDIGGTLATTVARTFITPTLSSDDEDPVIDSDKGELTENDVACEEAITEYDYNNPNLSYKTLIYYINKTCDSNNGEVYVFNYTMLLGLICSVVMAIIILGFTIDVAVRTIKLSLLRLIAPVPIISYITPGSEKNGAFGNWVKSLTSTYIDLFLRIAIIYFGAYIIILISEGGINIWQNSTGGFFTSLFATVFIIIGILVFMKDAPKFIKDMLGIKGDGKLFSGLGTMLGAAALTGGLAGSVATNARTAYEESQMAGHGKIRSLAAGALGVGTGAVGGLWAGGKALATSDKKRASSVMSAMQKRNAMRASHSTALGRLSSGAYGMFTGNSLAEKDKYVLESNQNAIKQLKDWKSFTEGEAKKKGHLGYTKQAISTTDGHTSVRAFNYSRLVAAMNAKDSRGNFKYGGLEYNVREFDENTMADILKSQTSDYVKSVFSGDAENPGILSNWELAKKALADANIKYEGDYLDPDVIGPTIGIASSAVQRMQTDVKHIKHIANHNANKK